LKADVADARSDRNVECSEGDDDDDWNNNEGGAIYFRILVFNLSREGDGLKVEWQAEALSLNGVRAAVDSRTGDEDRNGRSTNHIKRFIQRTQITAERGVTKRDQHEVQHITNSRIDDNQ
jgi:hypothetical protein